MKSVYNLNLANYKTPQQFIDEFNKNNFFKKREDKNPLLLNEVILGGDKIRKFKENNRTLSYHVPLIRG